MMRSVSALMVLLAASVGSTSSVAASKPAWDRAANIREAAHRLVGIQNERGALGTFKYIAACYQTHLIAQQFSAPLEGCIAQDYLLTQTMVMIYERLPPDQRQQMGVAEPQQLARGLSGRVGTALTQYKMTEADGEELRKLVQKEGFPVFFKERFGGAKR